MYIIYYRTGIIYHDIEIYCYFVSLNDDLIHLHLQQDHAHFKLSVEL